MILGTACALQYHAGQMMLNLLVKNKKNAVSNGLRYDFNLNLRNDNIWSQAGGSTVLNLQYEMKNVQLEVVF